QERLDDASQKYRDATEQVSALKQRVAQEEATRMATARELEQNQAQLTEANLKYRRVAAEEVPLLKSKLEEHYSIKRQQQHVIEQLKLDVKNNKKTLAEANAKLQKLQQQKMAAEQQVIKTRASLSFQLGYLLIHSVKSVRGIIGLPGALWAWRKELLKRRAQKNHRLKALEVVAPTKTNQVVAKAVIPEWQKPIVTQSISEITEHLPPVLIPASAPVKYLRQLKVACIMDEFTFGSYCHECDTQQLTPDQWEAELKAFQPELLFIESAWRGKDELWGSKVGHTSQELQGIVAWCRTMEVPTVFWNKEDPVHFETFLTTAKLFDYVFTTDIDCIHRYKAALRHERVYLLPFACQPANNNPIETYDRKDAFCFAGAYYVRYPERTRDLGNFVAELPAFRPLEIYDRNFGKTDPNYQFPPEYQPYIVGTLPFDQIDKAYKGYRYAINLNSIKQSQSMFARRVFELLASNTITVSNFSRGVRLMFGDLVATTDSGSEMVRHLNNVAKDEQHSRKLRLAALRKVLTEHTYEHRLAYVLSKVTKQTPQNTLPHIAVVAMARTQAELDSILHQYQQQHYTNSNLVIVVASETASARSISDSRIRLLSSPDIDGQTVRAVVGDVHLVAAMAAEDHYGPNYLLDYALATRYSGADVIGKAAYFTLLDGAPTLQHAEAAYRPANSLAARSAVIRFNKVADAILAEWLAGLATSQLVSDNGLAIDEFNYCRNGAEPAVRDVVSVHVDDLQGLNTGISIDELLMRAERIAPEATGHDESPVLTGKQLAIDFGKAPSAAIKLEVEYDHWRIDSTLPDGKHEYLYATADHSVNKLGVDKQFKFYLDTTPGLNIQLVILFLDAQKQKISHVIKHPNRNQEADIPLGTASIRFGLRFYAGGSAEIKGLVLGHRNLQPAEMIGQAEHLVLTNHYPSYEDLYRNGFVHSRVRAYRERGVRCDVFRLRPDESVSFHEFEDVDVTTGSQEVLNKMLCSGQYKNVLVHFLDPSMWEVLQLHIDNIKVVVWIHGAEIQPWHRRDFNYQTEDQRTIAKMKSEKRMAFWRELLQSIPANLKLVFVSRYFAEEVMEDLGFRISEDHYTIIHNPINTDTFNYREKPTEQRKKVLSIRPYASAKYANDLSVKAIQLLSSKPWFHDMEFRMIGDGALFEETLAPLREFRNVYIEQRFLKQDEIARLHKEYGIFLCPTRMDAQGVSRDEAMSSGLVPVTNNVTAIPEFVDDSCGILAPGDDPVAMANGIAELYERPKLFAVMSKAASDRVAHQSSKQKIIDVEIGFLK
ncbi:MAG TPA: glycosyltransferase, partial [Burkholderiaceae bacterium]|nr:glycosyltransferase [Burkholderiaceae bacterium]